MPRRMHWARWGDPAQAAPLSDDARGLVELAFGGSTARPTTPLADVRLPAAALTDAQLAALADLVGPGNVHVDHEARVRHTRGKSTPDLLRMRSGDGSAAPDAVVSPAGHDDVAALLRWCTEERVAAVPFGGGTAGGGGVGGDPRGHGGGGAPGPPPPHPVGSVGGASPTPLPQAGGTRPGAEGRPAA